MNWTGALFTMLILAGVAARDGSRQFATLPVSVLRHRTALTASSPSNWRLLHASR